MNCSICNNEIEKEIVNGKVEHTGHNAQPVNDGRCCDNCNQTVVIPARLKEIMSKVFPQQQGE
jgi:hypothetical protein